jgi:hypothetical protein
MPQIPDSPRLPWLHGFVTSVSYSGFGFDPLETGCDTAEGVGRADCVCQFRADNANPPIVGEFVARISDGSVSALERLAAADANGPWFNTNHDPAAQSREDLVTCETDCLQNGVNYDERANQISVNVWTGTMEDGTGDPSP